jgi:hypothetical protein
MISRARQGLNNRKNADVCEKLLETENSPGIASRGI